tara:strand:+ start:9127 stop:11730 length:2604 start_codon:yes stop_codon:yes gene_type:complete
MANISIGGIGFDLRAYGGKFDKDVKKAMGSFGRQVRAMGGGIRNAGAGLTAGLTLPLVAFGVTATKVFAGFESEMAKVKAVSGATGEEFAMLEKEAKRLGASTRFAASEVAGLQLEYSKLGFKPEEIRAATEATLALAQATDSDLATSAAVAGGTLRGFQLDATEMTRVTDVMAKSFSSSALDLAKFKDAMKFVAPVAAAANVSLEESSALLSVLSDNMISGSQAGTSLRRIIGDMEKTGKPFAEALDAIADKGITLTDAFDEVGRTAQTALLVLAKNRDKVKALTSSYEDSAGAAAAMAAIMDDTSAGAMKRFSSAFESLQITVGGILSKTLTPLINKLGEWVGKFSQLDESTQGMIVKAGLFAAALGPIAVAAGAVIMALPALAGGLAAIGGLISAPVLAALAVIAATFAAVVTHKDKIIEVVSGMVTTARAWFEKWRSENAATIAKLSEAWTKFSAAAVELFGAIVDKVATSTKGVIDKLDAWLEPIGGLQGAFEIFADVVVSSLTFAFNFLSGKFAEISEIIKVSESGWEFFGRIIWMVVKNIGATFAKLVTLAGEGIIGMKDAFLSFDWSGLGADIIAGIGKGLAAGAEKLKEAGQDLADTVWNATRERLGINSPAKKYIEIGFSIIEGLTNGIVARTPDATKAAAALGEATVKATKGGLDAFNDLGKDSADTFEDFFSKIKSGLHDGKLDFKEWGAVAGSAVDGLTKAFGGKGGGGLLGSLGKVFGALGGESTGSSIGDAFGGLFGTGGKEGGGGILSGIGKIFGGFFADGGRPPTGRASIIGEEGPEIFLPDTAGTVIPADALRSSGGGASPTIVVNNNFSAGVTRAELASVIPRLQKNITRGIVDGIQRGGGFRRVMQS